MLFVVRVGDSCTYSFDNILDSKRRKIDKIHNNLKRSQKDTTSSSHAPRKKKGEDITSDASGRIRNNTPKCRQHHPLQKIGFLLVVVFFVSVHGAHHLLAHPIHDYNLRVVHESFFFSKFSTRVFVGRNLPFRCRTES